jgi:nucleotide-binding universal stress UspA family protein
MNTPTAPKTAPVPAMRLSIETTGIVGSSSPAVLVAVDGLDRQHSAVKFAAALARERSARVCVVHVREREFFGRASFDLETAEEARLLVDDAVSELEQEGVEASGYVVRALVGQVGEVILDEAAKVGAEEIVLGAKRFGGLLSRRTRERLLRRSSLPVLVAPRPHERAGRGEAGAEPGRRRAA